MVPCKSFTISRLTAHRDSNGIESSIGDFLKVRKGRPRLPMLLKDLRRIGDHGAQSEFIDDGPVLGLEYGGSYPSEIKFSAPNLNQPFENKGRERPTVPGLANLQCSHPVLPHFGNQTRCPFDKLKIFRFDGEHWIHKQ